VSTESKTDNYQRLTPKAAFQLTSAHTWIASMGPVIVGGTLTIGLGDFTPLDLVTHNWLAVVIGILMLLTAVLAQSAVNTLNDYYDYKKGTDTIDNCVDTTDAAIIYHKLNPKAARNFAIACISAAFVTGLIVVLLSTPLVLIMGLIGAVTLVLYSAGPKPISYLPVGELISGLVMGGIITCATYLAMTGHLSLAAVLGAIPPTLTIALIMQVNNTADIQRDKEAGRRTLPILLGERRSASMIVTLHVVTLLYCAGYILTIAPWGIFIILLAVIPSYSKLKILWNGPYNVENRTKVMKTTIIQAIITNGAFILAITLRAHFA